MIHSIEIKNFRCFKHLKLSDCARINILVGDNGSGKTAFLEALFLTLSGNVEVGARLRIQRGADSFFNGTAKAIEDSLWRQYFYNFDWREQIIIRLEGSGQDTRSLVIGKTPSEIIMPIEILKSEEYSWPITFTWKNSAGHEFPYTPTVGANGVNIPNTLEDLPNYFHVAANQTLGASENATRFAELSRSGRKEAFVKIFTDTYDWIDDMGLDVQAGLPVVSASIKKSGERIPITSISGGINRLISILLTISSRAKSVVAIDEMENGVYYKHHKSYWEVALNLARKFESQLFISTHSLEWMRALVEAAGDNVDDIALWRIERDDVGDPELFRFDGKTLRAGIEFGVDPRGGTD